MVARPSDTRGRLWSAGALQRRSSSTWPTWSSRIAAAAPQALLEEPALHAVPRGPERHLEMLPRDGTMTAAQLELAQCGGIEGIVRQPFAVGDRVKLLEPSFCAVLLSDGDRAVECDHRGRSQVHQPVVEGDDRRPVRLLEAPRARVHDGDRRLEVVRAHLFPR